MTSMKRFLSLIALMLSFQGLHAATITMADPTIFYEDGYFYLTGTDKVNSGFSMYRSTDLVHWTSVGNARNGLAMWKDDTFGTGSFWAPQIFKHEGKYYIAYAANELIGIASSDSPMGPYKQESIHELPHSTGQIDPYVFIDDDGTKYMYYVRFVGGNTLYVVKLTDDFSSIKENTITRCLGADEGTWECAWNYGTGKITEGPTVIKDGGYYYLLYSANDFRDIDYAVGYAYSKSPTGPWTKVGHPFLSRHNTGINGSGHGDLFQDAEGNWYYVFHVHASNSEVGARRTAIVPITLTDDPKNKFIPDIERMYLLDNSSSASASFPEGGKRFEVDGIHYNILNTNQCEVTFADPVNFGGYTGRIEIPSRVENDEHSYRVSGIGYSAFYKCSGLTCVDLPTSVTSLGQSAFESSGIREIELGTTLTTLGDMAFKGCNKIQDVVASRTMPRSIPEDMFSPTVYQRAKLWVPSGREAAYQSTTGWKSFNTISGKPGKELTYDFTQDGFFFQKNKNMPNRCLVSFECAEYASYRGPDISVPSTVESDGETFIVTEIGRNAFRESRLIRNVVLPESVDTINYAAFYDCYDLESIDMPKGLLFIGNESFRSCTSLNTIIVRAQEPPRLVLKSVIPNNVYTDATLYVPFGCIETYREATNWKNFKNLAELPADDTSIQDVLHQSTNRDSRIFSLDGKYVGTEPHHLSRGIYVRNGKKILR